MSRIGKKPIRLPSGVKIKIGEQLEVTGPKGTLTVPIPEGISLEQVDGRDELGVGPRACVGEESRDERAERAGIGRSGRRCGR